MGPVPLLGPEKTVIDDRGARPATTSMSRAASPICAPGGPAVHVHGGDRGVGPEARLVGGDVAGGERLELEDPHPLAGPDPALAVERVEAVGRGQLIGRPCPVRRPAPRPAAARPTGPPWALRARCRRCRRVTASRRRHGPASPAGCGRAGLGMGLGHRAQPDHPADVARPATAGTSGCGGGRPGHPAAAQPGLDQGHGEGPLHLGRRARHRDQQAVGRCRPQPEPEPRPARPGPRPAWLAVGPKVAGELAAWPDSGGTAGEPGVGHGVGEAGQGGRVAGLQGHVGRDRRPWPAAAPMTAAPAGRAGAGPEQPDLWPCRRTGPGSASTGARPPTPPPAMTVPTSDHGRHRPTSATAADPDRPGRPPAGSPPSQRVIGSVCPTGPRAGGCSRARRRCRRRWSGPLPPDRPGGQLGLVTGHAPRRHRRSRSATTASWPRSLGS